MKTKDTEVLGRELNY